MNGWSFSAIATARTGAPLNILSGKDYDANANSSYDRPNLAGDPSIANRSAAAWFNTAAFAQPAAGTDGNVSFDFLTAPGLKNVDLGIFRNFKIRERVTLQFRVEMTNPFNIVNLGSPNLTETSALFGQISSASAMRQSQLGLRLAW